MKAKLISGKTVLIPSPQENVCECGSNPTNGIMWGDCNPAGDQPKTY